MRVLWDGRQRLSAKHDLARDIDLLSDERGVRFIVERDVPSRRKAQWDSPDQQFRVEVTVLFENGEAQTFTSGVRRGGEKEIDPRGNERLESIYSIYFGDGPKPTRFSCVVDNLGSTSCSVDGRVETF